MTAELNREKVTPQQVMAEVEKNREEWLEFGIKDNPELRIPVFASVYLYGMWLSKRLEEVKASDEEREDACFALGQRMMGHDVALRALATSTTWNRWLQGDKDVPGEKLGAELLREKETRMTQYRKKPVVIDAVRLTKETKIETFSGPVIGDPGDWLLTGVNGEKYPCKDDIFKKTYEPI